MRTSIRLACLLAAFVAGTAPAQAQRAYPDKPARLIVPFAPGGGTDIIARVLSAHLTEAFGHSVIVDNRPGAGGRIGEEMIVRASPDGYTLGMVSGYGTNAAIYKLPYDPVNDIQAVIAVGEAGFVIALHPTVQAKTIGDLIAIARASPGKLNYGSSGTGAITHLSSALFDLMAGITTTHVPFKGTGPALAALLGGQVEFMLGSMPATAPHVKAGRLRGVAVTTKKRSSALPDIAPLGDTVPGYEAVIVYGVTGPKGVPAEAVRVWNTAVNKVLLTAQMKERLVADGIEAVGGAPSVMHEAVKRDVEKWRRVVRDAKLTFAS
jgi:tripartite-type tricarboxylate transporter receptor subunit TctC